MGFRSTFTTIDRPFVKWPDWFREKYKEFVHFPWDCGTISAQQECKFHTRWSDLEKDIQKAIDWSVPYHKHHPFVMVYLHECGGVERVEISQFHITRTIPSGWELHEPDRGDLGHGYWCHRCSHSEKAVKVGRDDQCPEQGSFLGRG